MNNVEITNATLAKYLIQGMSFLQYISKKKQWQ
jgi:hypothetical protein